MYWWLSFRDPEKNLHLGCCIVEADGGYGAVLKAKTLGINPGGEVLVVEVETPELETNRLFSREELVGLDYPFSTTEAYKSPLD